MLQRTLFARSVAAAVALVVGCLLGPSPAALAADPRVALVVGVSAYRQAPSLPNTINDAGGMSAALQRVGFRVRTVLDPDRAQLEAAVRQFGNEARGAEAAVFYYAGHAVEVSGRNWVLPTSVELKSPRDLRFEALDLESLLEQVDGAARVTILLLDACRENPFEKRLTTASRGLSARGLGQVAAGAGTLVAFSTAPGTVAADGAGANSPFTAALLRHLEVPGLEVRQMLGRVRRDVREATRGAQVPWENSALEGEFYFAPVAPVAPVAATAPVAASPAGQTSAQVASPADATAPRTAPSAAEPQALDPFGQSLSRRLTEMAPGLARADEWAAAYVKESGHKAMAVSLNPPATWRIGGAASAVDARAAVLQTCAVFRRRPCQLAVIDETLTVGAADGPGVMPLEVSYEGPFDPRLIPGYERTRTRNDVADYRKQRGPKAAAYHPWGRLFIAAGLTQHEAETVALERCNGDQGRRGRDGPCYLYAAGDAVVLPQRRRAPIAQP